MSGPGRAVVVVVVVVTVVAVVVVDAVVVVSVVVVTVPSCSRPSEKQSDFIPPTLVRCNMWGVQLLLSIGTGSKKNPK